MNWTLPIGIIATVCLLVPALLIFPLRLYRYTSLLFLSFYYFITALYNFMDQGLVPASPQVLKILGIITNYLDAPLMLMVLLFFCREQWKKKILYYTIGFFLTYEIVISFIYGFTNKSLTQILGPGILLIVLYSFSLFKKYGKLTVVHGKNLGITLMLISISFSYGCFGIIYLLHYIERVAAVDDVHFIYYLVMLLSALCMATGLVLLRKRIQQIKEVQLTRKELALIFNH